MHLLDNALWINYPIKSVIRNVRSNNVDMTGMIVDLFVFSQIVIYKLLVMISMANATFKTVFILVI